MENNQDPTALANRKDWVKSSLLPGITSGSVGGAIVGCCCGFLLAPPHHFAETVLGGTLAGATIGFTTTWMGAVVVRVFYFLLNR